MTPQTFQFLHLLSEVEYNLKSYGDRDLYHSSDHTKAESNNCLICYWFTENNFQFKTSQNMLTWIDVKFPSSFLCFSASSGDKGMISSADIPQIVSVVCRVVFLLFLAVVRLFLRCKTFEIFRYFCTALPRQRQPRPQGFYAIMLWWLHIMLLKLTRILKSNNFLNFSFCDVITSLLQ